MIPNILLGCEGCTLLHMLIGSFGFIAAGVWACWSDFKRFLGL